MAEMLNIKKIKQQANYLWRVGATGFSFTSFGVGGVVIGGGRSGTVQGVFSQQPFDKFLFPEIFKSVISLFEQDNSFNFSLPLILSPP